MATYVIGAILLVVFAYALKNTVGHFRGEGSCCGGGCGGGPCPKHKSLSEDKIGEKAIFISGMHCPNCQRHVEMMLNTIDGAAATVDLKRGEARLLMSRPVSDEEIEHALAGSDYRITAIKILPA